MALPSIKITEEPSKDGNGKPSTIFYVREHPVVPGRSMQATALNYDGARWQADRMMPFLPAATD